MARGSRVALMSCSGVLGGVIRELLARQPDVEVVRDLPPGQEHRLAEELRRSRPDVVVWHLDDDRMLAEHPEYFGVDHTTSVLAVYGDSGTGSLWQLRPQRAELGELGPSTLVAAVRAAGRA
ncbi:hypothetical protein [Kutzneria sp. CA-103260]|uniref:hypothetical protein n=1 Tax=Kutzneria sp. CA-103260 TaxID=2802641 RepID=UPI001BA64727|nr:hypothetical protein [Kutzneria sp. CA-103260]QUQ65646.1 hypothetical protein JJ691_33700 [Kutzneria sp. CA-103260]